MNVTDAPFRGAAELIRTDPEVDQGYRSVLSVLARTVVPLRTTPKSKARFIYDQTELQRVVRATMRELGWTHGQVLAADSTYDGERMSGLRADLLGHNCHVILEFGNRASWAHNLLTRGVASVATGRAKLLVFVAPRSSLADLIDSNLATFERIASMLSWLERTSPLSLPAPIFVVGVTSGSEAPAQ